MKEELQPSGYLTSELPTILILHTLTLDFYHSTLTERHLHVTLFIASLRRHYFDTDYYFDTD